MISVTFSENRTTQDELLAWCERHFDCAARGRMMHFERQQACSCIIFDLFKPSVFLVGLDTHD